MLHETLIWSRQPLTPPIILDTLLSKTTNPTAHAVSMMGEDWSHPMSKIWVEFSCLHPCISATNSSIQVKTLYRACKLKPYKKSSLQCAMCHESCEPWTIRFMRLPLSMRRTSFFRPSWKGRTNELIGKHFRVKRSINELNWYDRVPPPDWYRQKTISKEPRGGPLLGSFWIAEGLSPAEVHTTFHINIMKQGHQMGRKPR
jgi:hypothetical protein